MSVRFPRLVLGSAAAWLCLGAGAGAQTEEKDFYRRQFSDWGGIVFRCLPGSKTDPLQQELCADASAQARLLAATGKIPFEDLADKDFFEVVMATLRLKHALVLEVTTLATEGSPRAVYMRAEATAYYSDAVERNGEEGTPASKPRSGNLVLWSKDVISSGGSQAQMVAATSDAFDRTLKQFFAIFIESRN